MISALLEDKTAKGRLPGELAIQRFRLHFRGRRPYGITGYRGSTWRGVLGGALKRLVCITRDRECQACMLYRTCIYTYIFETPEERVSEEGARSEDAPHPFVLDVEANWSPRTVTGETVEFTLLGAGTKAWAYVAHALREGAQRGVGAERIPLELDGVEQESGERGRWVEISGRNGKLKALAAGTPRVPAMPGKARIRLLTPLRIRRENDLVEPERLGFDEFTAAVLRRLALVTRYHGEAMWRMDHAGLKERARQAKVYDRRTGWQDWARYSNRQGRKVPMGGVVGEMTVSMEGLEDLWPLLWIGQWLHAGKGTSMGLGRYELEAA